MKWDLLGEVCRLQVAKALDGPNLLGLNLINEPFAGNFWEDGRTARPLQCGLEHRLEHRLEDAFLASNLGPSRCGHDVDSDVATADQITANP